MPSSRNAFLLLLTIAAATGTSCASRPEGALAVRDPGLPAAAVTTAPQAPPGPGEWAT